MKISTICGDVKRFCECSPTVTCDYSMRSELRCKDKSKSFCEMTGDGYIQLPLTAVILIAVAVMGSCMCICSRCCRRHKD